MIDIIASSRTFGVEMEFIYPKIADVGKILRRSGEPVKVSDKYEHNNDNQEWVVKPDSSVAPGGEIASRVLKGRDGFERLESTVKILKESGVRADHKCGIHVHVSVSDFNEDQLGKLIALWIKCEPLVMLNVDPTRRANNYCPFIIERSFLKADTLYKPPTIVSAVASTRGSINTAGFNSKKRIEFRVMEGSFEPEDVVNWTRFIIYFVEFSKMISMVKNLNPFILIHMFTTLGLWPKKGQEETFQCSEEVDQMRRWFLGRIIQNAPSKGQSKLEQEDKDGSSVKLEVAFATKMLERIDQEVSAEAERAAG